jgi:hypothetical protein
MGNKCTRIKRHSKGNDCCFSRRELISPHVADRKFAFAFSSFWSRLFASFCYRFESASCVLPLLSTAVAHLGHSARYE